MCRSRNYPSQAYGIPDPLQHWWYGECPESIFGSEHIFWVAGRYPCAFIYIFGAVYEEFELIGGERVRVHAVCALVIPLTR